MAVSLPQAYLLWELLPSVELTAFNIALLAFKEALLGSLMGFALSTPYWALGSACALIDNQRGANQAHNNNPALSADASLLGELAERTLIVYLCQMGIFVLLFKLVADSYGVWPVLDALPRLSDVAFEEFVKLLASTLSDALIYSAPVLLVLLALEGGFAFIGSMIKGLDIHQMVPGIKTVLAPLIVILVFAGLWRHVGDSVYALWSKGGLLELLSR